MKVYISMVRFPAGRIRATEEPQRWRNRCGASYCLCLTAKLLQILTLIYEEKYILSFTVFSRFVIAKVLLIGTAVHFDGFFAVSLSGDSFPRLYKFVVSIAK